jgi:hypothetical protein
MGRQVGTVLGVAGLVAILAHQDQSDPIAVYRYGVVLIIAFFAGAGVVAASLLTAGAARPARPAAQPPALDVAGTELASVEVAGPRPAAMGGAGDLVGRAAAADVVDGAGGKAHPV